MRVFLWNLFIDSEKGGTAAHDEIASPLVHKAQNNLEEGHLAMIDEINAATPAPNAFPNDVQKTQEEVSNVQAEETSNINSTEKVEHNEKSSNAQAKETDHMESAQRDNEANEKSPTAQNESLGTIVDVLR